MTDAERTPALPVPRAERAGAAADQPVDGLTNLARTGAATLWRAVGWVARTSVETGQEIAKELPAAQPLLDLVEDGIEAARHTAQRALSRDEDDATAAHRSTPDAPPAGPTKTGTAADFVPPTATVRELRVAGDRLLRLSLDARNQSRHEHPAFAQVLQQLTPDEARILRYLALSGPQPCLDVRTRTPFGVSSELVVGGVNVVAYLAGCVHPDRDVEYLGNLARLGLLRFSSEQLADPNRYAFLEAQPVAVEAVGRVRKARTVYGTIVLTPFGKLFCEVCFTLHAELDDDA